jgi:hypothetical protein
MKKISVFKAAVIAILIVFMLSTFAFARKGGRSSFGGSRSFSGGSFSKSSGFSGGSKSFSSPSKSSFSSSGKSTGFTGSKSIFGNKTATSKKVNTNTGLFQGPKMGGTTSFKSAKIPSYGKTTTNKTYNVPSGWSAPTRNNYHYYGGNDSFMSFVTTMAVINAMNQNSNSSSADKLEIARLKAELMKDPQYKEKMAMLEEEKAYQESQEGCFINSIK